jgi:hypothetical protein
MSSIELYDRLLLPQTKEDLRGMGAVSRHVGERREGEGGHIMCGCAFGVVWHQEDDVIRVSATRDPNDVVFFFEAAHSVFVCGESPRAFRGVPPFGLVSPRRPSTCLLMLSTKSTWHGHI